MPGKRKKQKSEFTRADEQVLRETVDRLVEQTPITDIHTHLYAPEFGDLLLYGVDELITYHYLIAEAVRASRVNCADFYALDKKGQAEFIWKELFLERSPVSESCRGVCTALDKLGLDLPSRDLEAYREYFAGADLNEHIDNVFKTAGLESVVMTNDPFDDTERPIWEGGHSSDGRFRAALRIDPLLMDWQNATTKLKRMGYDTDVWFTPKTCSEVRRFLTEWVEKTKSLYMAVSLPPAFRYPEDSDTVTVLTECVLPVARQCGVPFAMMLGVKREVNPGLRLAGDGVGAGDVGAVERLCADFPGNKFMVTMLSRENQHTLCVAARKFGNLLPFGCWWFLNDPSLIEEMTRMRLELLGLTVIPQHSDARVLEQIIYKWTHSRMILAKVLGDKYADLVKTGWTVHEDEIRRDVAQLLGGVFWDFLK